MKYLSFGPVSVSYTDRNTWTKNKKLQESYHKRKRKQANNTYSGSFVFETVLPSEIELEIIMAPSNKAHGLYSCPIRLLKCSRHTGAHNPERSTAINSCNGVFTSEFIFRLAFPAKNNCSTRSIPAFDRRLDC